jgi:hypothetical protein
MKRKIILLLSTIFIIISCILFVIYLVKDDSTRWQVALGGIGVSALPLILLRKQIIPFNIPLILGYYFTLIVTLFLGSIATFYRKYEFWDSSVHFYKGIYIGFFSIALYKILVPTEYRKDVSDWILLIFILTLSTSSSVIWEIYEYIGDLLITHTMQLGGNKDTMLDLLCGFAGALVVAVYTKLQKFNV